MYTYLCCLKYSLKYLVEVEVWWLFINTILRLRLKYSKHFHNSSTIWLIKFYFISIFQCFRREQWPLFSSYTCWQQLVSSTRSLARDHAVLADLHSTHLVARLANVMEDVQRVYRRVCIILLLIIAITFSIY